MDKLTVAGRRQAVINLGGVPAKPTKRELKKVAQLADVHLNSRDGWKAEQEPTAYEDAMARKTGVPVEQLRKETTDATLATKPAPAPKVLRPVCPERKKNGDPCTARCAEGKETCVDHQPAWDRLTHDEHVAFGHWLRKARAKDVVEVIGWWKAKQIVSDWEMEQRTGRQVVDADPPASNRDAGL